MNESLGKLVLRIGLGAMMLPHGWGKLSNLISTGKFQFLDPLGIGPEISLVGTIIAEFFCSLLVLVGFKTKLATLPLMFTMLVAALIVHADDPFGKQEFPLLYFVGFLALFFFGPGEYSLDQWLYRKKYK